jgi:hypothetical protein
MKQVSEMRITIGINMNADCLLKNTSTKHSKYVVNQNVKHAILEVQRKNRGGNFISFRKNAKIFEKEVV